MPPLPTTARLAFRLSRRRFSKPTSRQHMHTSRRCLAAQNYTMPALSPTMTEGNISNWHIKEGDSFTTGDVLLEIETDKATMDVEAQDDGVLFKIMLGDGAKGVQVGQRIAVLAEAGDDLGSLEVPAEEVGADAKKGQKGEESSAGAKEAGGSKEVSSGAADPEISKPSAESAPSKAPPGQGQKQKYPLFPSVQSLLHENGLSDADADSIPTSGPNGRLLKGDVLAYLGKINKDYPAQSSKRLDKLSHLDLSNIRIAQPKVPSKPKEAAAPAEEAEVPRDKEVAVPVSLSAVIATQKRVQDTLGIFLPLSTFIARASELANTELPAAKHRTPTTDDLFNVVLGLDQVPQPSRGHFVPQITGLSTPSPRPRLRAKKPDIIDLLSSTKASAKDVSPADAGAVLGVSAGDNVFSVVVREDGEVERALEYLERMKGVLEREPGRLVL